LVNGLAADRKPIGREIILDVCRDFHIRSAQQVIVKPADPEVPETATDEAATQQAAEEAAPPVDEPLMFQKTARRRRFSFF
jgi:hypothetical protein